MIILLCSQFNVYDMYYIVILLFNNSIADDDITIIFYFLSKITRI